MGVCNFLARSSGMRQGGEKDTNTTASGINPASNLALSCLAIADQSRRRRYRRNTREGERERVKCRRRPAVIGLQKVSLWGTKRRGGAAGAQASSARLVTLRRAGSRRPLGDKMDRGSTRLLLIFLPPVRGVISIHATSLTSGIPKNVTRG